MNIKSPPMRIITNHLVKRKLPAILLLVIIIASIFVLLPVRKQHQAVTLPALWPSDASQSAMNPRGNPLIELHFSGKRVRSLPREAFVATIVEMVGLKWNHNSIQHSQSETDDVLALNYESCPLHNAYCLVTHPLPESIFPSAITYCLHHAPDYVSDWIKNFGVWEIDHCYFMWSILVQDPELQFIDIGANLGAMTMIAGKMGRQVIAVEPMKGTLDILCKSVIENDLTENMTIIPFAVSDRRTSFKTISKVDNWGATRLDNDPNATNTNTDMVTSILTDDILKFIKFPKALLKIDIERHEPQAFTTAIQLLRKVYIPVVIMEWGRMQDAINAGKPEGGMFVLDLLYGLGYTPYHHRGAKLIRRTHRKWGEDIYWLHQDYRIEFDPWTVY